MPRNNKENEKDAKKAEHPLEVVYQDKELQRLAQPKGRGYIFFTLLVAFVAGALGALAAVWGGYAVVTTGSVDGATKAANIPTQASESHKEFDASLQAVVHIVEPPEEENDALFGDAFVGTGIMLTADGWGITAQEVLARQDAAYLVVLSDGTRLTIDDFFMDKSTGSAYFHVTGQSTLPLIRLSEARPALASPAWVLQHLPHSTISSAEQVTIVANKYIVGEGAQRLLQEVETASFRYLMNGAGSDFSLGAAVVDTYGDLIGYVQRREGRYVVLPIHYVAKHLAQTLQLQEVARASFGVTYVDVALVAGLSAAQTQGLTAGALLVHNIDQGVVGVRQGGAAEEAGLAPGDIITRVNGTTLSSANSLVDTLWQYRPGQSVEIVYFRGGKEQRVDVTLQETN